MRCALAAARQERGDNIIEMAFIALVMFILVAGIVDLGGAYQRYIIITNASREGARMYARQPCTSATMGTVKANILAFTKNEADGSNVQLGDGNISLSPSLSSACPANGTAVGVSVQINYQTSLGQFWGGTAFPIRAQTWMMYYGVD